VELPVLNYNKDAIYELNAFLQKLIIRRKLTQKEHSVSRIIYFKLVQKYIISHETHKNSTEHNKEISLNIKINTNNQLSI